MDGPPPVEGTAIETACAAPVWRPNPAYRRRGRAPRRYYRVREGCIGVVKGMRGYRWEISAGITCRGRATASLVQGEGCGVGTERASGALQCQQGGMPCVVDRESEGLEVCIGVCGGRGSEREDGDDGLRSQEPMPPALVNSGSTDRPTKKKLSPTAEIECTCRSRNAKIESVFLIVQLPPCKGRVPSRLSWDLFHHVPSGCRDVGRRPVQSGEGPFHRKAGCKCKEVTGQSPSRLLTPRRPSS